MRGLRVGSPLKFHRLWNLVFDKENAWRDRFAAIPFEDKGGKWQARYYQHNAIENALEAIANGRNRILLTLATGTVKATALRPYPQEASSTEPLPKEAIWSANLKGFSTEKSAVRRCALGVVNIGVRKWNRMRGELCRSYGSRFERRKTFSGSQTDNSAIRRCSNGT
jgi:hypothetical protein